MRHLVSGLLICGLWLGLALSIPGQGKDATRALVEKAIKAHGGTDKLNKAEASHVKMTGTLDFLQGAKFASDTFIQPGKFKIVIEATINNMNFTITQVYDGKALWVNVMNKTMEIKDAEILKAIEENKHGERLSRLVGLLDKGVELSPLGEIKIDGNDAVGVRASAKGHKDVNLYFDKKTHLLVKAEARAVDPLTKKETTQESIFSDYHPVDGLQTARRMVVSQDGKRSMTLEVTSTRYVERHDDSVFAKP
jgi:hypothetical protein